MSPDQRGFSVRETHGILLRPTNEVWASSENRGWRSLYASTQREEPYEDRFAGVEDHLVILHLDGPVVVDRALGRGSTRRLIAPGGMFIMPGGFDFGVRLGGRLSTLHVYLRRATVEQVAGEMVPGDPAGVEILPRIGDGDPLLERMLLGVRDTLFDDDPTSIAYVDYMANAIAAHLVRGHSSARSRLADRATPQRLGRRQLAGAIEFMEANLEHSIDVAAIARAVHLSPSHFAREFRVTMGMAPHRYLMQLRVERAARLLAESALSVAEIAFACGFSHQEHLTRLFKRTYATTPAAYRRARRS